MSHVWVSHVRTHSAYVRVFQRHVAHERAMSAHMTHTRMSCECLFFILVFVVYKEAKQKKKLVYEELGSEPYMTAATEIATPPKIHQIEILRFLGISRYKFKVSLWFDLNAYQEIRVPGFGGFRGLWCSIFSGNCHMKNTFRGPHARRHRQCLPCEVHVGAHTRDMIYIRVNRASSKGARLFLIK